MSIYFYRASARSLSQLFTSWLLMFLVYMIFSILFFKSEINFIKYSGSLLVLDLFINCLPNSIRKLIILKLSLLSMHIQNRISHTVKSMLVSKLSFDHFCIFFQNSLEFTHQKKWCSRVSISLQYSHMNSVPLIFHVKSLSLVLVIWFSNLYWKDCRKGSFVILYGRVNRVFQSHASRND